MQSVLPLPAALRVRQSLSLEEVPQRKAPPEWRLVSHRTAHLPAKAAVGQADVWVALLGVLVAVAMALLGMA